MRPWLILSVIAAYFLLLYVVSRITSRGADNQSFFLGNRNSPWYLVAFGMIGTSLSGVTFISVPGWVEGQQFAYMQMIMGFLVGYLVIGYVLIPLYYRLNLTSIYQYFNQRFGFWSYKTGSASFFISRIVGAALRLYLVAGVLDLFVLGPLGFPYPLTIVLTIALIWVYTAKGGIKTVVYTDTIQTAAMLLAVVLTLFFLAQQMDLSAAGLVQAVKQSEYSTVFFFNDFAQNKYHFVKQFLSGALVALVMTGMDQDMMQKNLSCRNEKESRKNVLSLSVFLLPVNLLFLSLGALLYIFAHQQGIAIESADHLFPEIALNHMPVAAGVLFTLGLIAAAYSSADSALTSLTTAFCVDFLGIEKKAVTEQTALRKRVHIGMSLVLMMVVFSFSLLGNDSIVDQVYKFASFTYGPLLGMFAYGLLTRWQTYDLFVPFIALLSVGITILLFLKAKDWWGIEFGYTLLLVNGSITFAGMFIAGLIKRSTYGKAS